MNEPAHHLIPERDIVLGPLAKNILRIVLYFDIFSHPLKASEIYQCCPEEKISFRKVDDELRNLVERQLLKSDRGFFIPVREDATSGHVMRRIDGEEKAREALKIARLFTRIISFFPFVRGIYISGSLSKGYMDHDTDIDYFIITARGRLWLSRSLLVLFKKIFLLNSRKYFCINYFIDTESLQIPDRNFFTATELVFILPAYNYELYTELIRENPWIRAYYPHFPLREKEGVLPVKKPLIKTAFEKLLSGTVGEKLDAWFYKTTLKHWKKKFAHFDESTFDHRLRSKKNVSKHHPRGFQARILDAWEERIRKFETRHGIDLG